MMRIRSVVLVFAAVVWCLAPQAGAQTPLGSEFTYQGDLKQAGVPFDGTADFDFALWDADVDGSQVGSTVSLLGVTVTEGLFTVELDFGVDALNGDQRWLEIMVDGVLLSPRQKVTGAPYALQTRGLFVDDAGNVGIGTTTPATELDVDGVVTATETNLINVVPTLRFSASGTPRTSHIAAGFNPVDKENQSILFNVSDNTPTGTTEVMRLRGDGRVGIGTDTPATELDVVGTVTATSFVGDGSGLTGIDIDPQDLAGVLGQGNDAGGADMLNLGTVNAAAFSSTSPLQLQTAGTTRIYVDDVTGNVGIGTTTPTSALDVAGGNVSLNGGWLSGDGENEGVFVLDNGNVGIGLTGTGEKFGVAGGIRVEGKIINDAGLTLSGGGSGVTVLLDEDGGSFDTFTIKDTGEVRFVLEGDTGTVIATAFVGDGSGLTGISGGDPSYGSSAGSPDDAVFINDAGNVGIGTDAPATELDVVGAVTATSFVGDGSGLTGLAGSTVDLDNLALLRWDLLNHSFPVGNFPWGLAFDGDNIWVVNDDSDTVTKLRASDGVEQPGSPFPAGPGPEAVAFDGANIWVANQSSDTVTKLRASDGAILDTFPVGDRPNAMAFDGANIWVTNGNDDNVTKLQASDGAPQPGSPFPVGDNPHGVAFDGANIWVVNHNSDNVTKLRASDGARQPGSPFTVGAGPFGVAFDGANIWVTNQNTNNVTKLRASDGVEQPGSPFPVGSAPFGVAFDGANIWVTNQSSDNVTKLRASDGANLGTFPVGLWPLGVVFDGANIWTANNDSDNLTRISLVK